MAWNCFSCKEKQILRRIHFLLKKERMNMEIAKILKRKF